ncbi:MAG: hypothetical protein RR404_01165 [Bacilli bacterium]
MIVARLILFMISFSGLCLFATKKKNINFAFAPLFIVSTISIIMFICGIFNVLLIGSILIFIIGIIMFMYYIRSIDINYINKRMIIIFVGLLTLLIILLWNIHFLQYDNFSHWGLIAKYMYIYDSFPTQINSNVVTFITYPPGSACFIYYFSKILGNGSDAVFAFAQSFILISSIIPLSTFVKRKSFSQHLAFVFIIIVSLSMNIQINSLPVDTLLATIGATLTIIIYEYRKNVLTVIETTIPIMIFLVLIKNSGMYFVLGNMVLMFFFLLKYNSNIKKRDLAKIIVSFLLPFLSLFLWQAHIKLCFTQEIIETAKHTMSINYYIHNLQMLNWNQIIDVAKAFISNFLLIKDPTIVLFYLLDVVAFATFFYSYKKNLIPLLFLNLYHFVYIILLFATYIFSLPYEEAIVLSSFNRYYMTSILYFIIVLAYLYILGDKKNLSNICILITSIYVIFNFCDLKAFSPGYFEMQYNQSYLKKLELKIQKTIIDKNKPIIIKVDDADLSKDTAGYLAYYLKYKLMTSNFSLTIDSNIKKSNSYTLIE